MDFPPDIPARKALPAPLPNQPVFYPFTPSSGAQYSLSRAGMDVGFQYHIQPAMVASNTVYKHLYTTNNNASQAPGNHADYPHSRASGIHTTTSTDTAEKISISPRNNFPSNQLTIGRSQCRATTEDFLSKGDPQIHLSTMGVSGLSRTTAQIDEVPRLSHKGPVCPAKHSNRLTPVSLPIQLRSTSMKRASPFPGTSPSPVKARRPALLPTPPPPPPSSTTNDLQWEDIAMRIWGPRAQKQIYDATSQPEPTTVTGQIPATDFCKLTVTKGDPDENDNSEKQLSFALHCGGNGVNTAKHEGKITNIKARPVVGVLHNGSRARTMNGTLPRTVSYASVQKPATSAAPSTCSASNTLAASLTYHVSNGRVISEQASPKITGIPSPGYLPLTAIQPPSPELPAIAPGVNHTTPQTSGMRFDMTYPSYLPGAYYDSDNSLLQKPKSTTSASSNITPRFDKGMGDVLTVPGGFNTTQTYSTTHSPTTEMTHTDRTVLPKKEIDKKPSSAGKTDAVTTSRTWRIVTSAKERRQDEHEVESAENMKHGGHDTQINKRKLKRCLGCMADYEGSLLFHQQHCWGQQGRDKFSPRHQASTPQHVNSHDKVVDELHIKESSETESAPVESDNDEPPDISTMVTLDEVGTCDVDSEQMSLPECESADSSTSREDQHHLVAGYLCRLCHVFFCTDDAAWRHHRCARSHSDNDESKVRLHR